MKKTIFFVFGIIFLFLVFQLVFAEEKTPSEMLDVNLTIPKLTAEEIQDAPRLTDGGVLPPFGQPCTKFFYKVLYEDEKGREPEYVRIWLNGKWYDMEKVSGDYKTGAWYIFEYVPNSGESNFYFFEASNGAGKTRTNIIDSPDQGPLMYSESFKDNKIILFHKNSAELLWSFDIGKKLVSQVAISKDGKYAGAAATNTIYFFSTEKGLLWQFFTTYGEPSFPMASMAGIAISADGKYIAASVERKLYFFEKESNKPKWFADIESEAIGIDISDNGEYIAVGVGNAGEKGDKIFFFNNKGEKLWEYKAEHPEYQQTGNFYRPAITPDGKYVAVSTGCPDRRAYLFSKDGTLLFRSEMLTKDSPVHKSAISDDGSLIAYSFDHEQGKEVLMVFSKEGKKLWGFSSPEDVTARAVSMSSDGKYIAIGTTAGNVYLFSKDSNVPLWKFSSQGNFTQIGDVALSSDGELLAAGTTGVYLFSKNSNKPLWHYTVSDTWVNTVAFNDEYIVAGTGMLEYMFEGNSASPEEVECKNIEEVYSLEQLKKDYMNDIEDDIGDDWAEKEAICGDSICEEEKGESYENCPEDCVPEKDNEDILEISKRQGNLWIILVPVISIILIVAVIIVIIIMLKYKRRK